MFQYKIVDYSDIPDIDLYMDQVINFLEKKLIFFKESEDDLILTKTMINNYVKSSLIPKPIKKKYGRDHISKLIMLYFLKNILSINDIKEVFELENNSQELYNRFNLVHKNIIDNFNEGNDSKILWETDKVSLIFELALKADLYKRMATKEIKKDL